jgi:nucleoid-associated protein YejK
MPPNHVVPAATALLRWNKMALRESDFISVIREVLSHEPGGRTAAADGCVDVLSHYSSVQVRALAVVLSSLSAIETSSEALEAQLNALLELGQTGFVAPEDLASVRNIHRVNLSQELSKYVSDLLQEN